MIGDQVITVKPYLDEDQFGDPSYGTPYQIPDVIVWSRQSDELERGGTIIDGQNVYIPPNFRTVPPGKPLPNAKDRLVFDGQEYDVDGKPGAYPLGGESHTLVVLKGTGS